jgi:uncharacterized membrane protein
MNYKDLMEVISKIVDVAGVAVIVLGAVFATLVLLRDMIVKGREPVDPYRIYRETLGKSILLGLEFLIAGDIIRTVAVAPTFTNLGTLAILVVIRSVLSIELEMEIDGYWPWQRRRVMAEAKGGETGKEALG